MSSFEDDLCRAELDAIAGPQQLSAASLAAVDEHTVGGAEVGDRPPVRSRANLGVPARDPRIVDHHVAIATAPDDAAPGRHDQPAVTECQQYPLRARLGTGLFERPLQTRRSAVDHRLAVLFLFNWRLRSLILAVGPDQPRLNAEFTERQTLVGMEGDVQPRGEDQIFATRVLEQIRAQLVDHVVFNPLVATAVLGRKPHGVLVRRIHPRDGHGAMGIHLTRELAGKLHRADLRAKHASENPLDEVGDCGLDALERVHRYVASADHSPISRQP